MATRQKIILSAVLVGCTFLSAFPLLRSGLNYPFGIGFWGPLGHDFVWHLSLINNMTDVFRINLAVFSGSLLQNYHPFYDILLFLISRIIGISSSLLLFQIFPLLMGFLFFYLSFLIGRKLTGSVYGGLLLMVLNAINNSFGWIITFIRSRQFSGESLFWAMQSPSSQINPPFFLSLLLLEIIILILLNPAARRFRHLLVIFLVLILLPITKVYSALIGFGLTGIYSLYELFKFRKLSLPAVVLVSAAVAFILFRIYNPDSSSLLQFRPFWFVNSMIESPDRLYLPRLANIRYALEASGRIGPKLIAVWSITLVMFLVGNFAWRLLGIFSVIRTKGIFRLSALLLIIISALIPLLFVQKNTGWNTIQFLYYGLFLGNVLLADYLINLKSPFFRQGFIGLVLLTNLLALTGTISQYTGVLPPTAIPPAELTALSFLKSTPPGTVLTFPYDAYLKKTLSNKPLPLYAYETTAYVSAYSRHNVYLEDEMNLGNSNYPYSIRRLQSDNFFRQADVYQDRGFLVNNQIDYIYLTGVNRDILSAAPKELYLKNIYHDSQTSIFKVLR